MFRREPVIPLHNQGRGARKGADGILSADTPQS